MNMKMKIIILAGAFLIAAGSLSAQPSTTASPDGLVKDLYRVHNQKHSPFFQTRNRALLDKYFEKPLADLIWKDARSSKGEVGVIDGDPLYDAQDMEIKKFAIAKPRLGRDMLGHDALVLAAALGHAIQTRRQIGRVVSTTFAAEEKQRPRRVQQ